MKSFKQFIVENRFSLSDESEFVLGRAGGLPERVTNKLILLFLNDPEATMVMDPKHAIEMDPAYLRNEINHNPRFQEDAAAGKIKTFRHDETGELYSIGWLNHIADWVRADPRAANIIIGAPRNKKIKELYDMADKFFEDENKRKQAQLEDDERNAKPFEEVLKVGEFTWVRLLSNAEYLREGEKMQNCIGTYCTPDDLSHIYSLRTANNEPKVSIELMFSRFGSQTPDVVTQIKGKQNRPSLAKPYRNEIVELLNYLKVRTMGGMEGKEDLQGAGIYMPPHSGKFVVIPE